MDTRFRCAATYTDASLAATAGRACTPRIGNFETVSRPTTFVLIAATFPAATSATYTRAPLGSIAMPIAAGSDPKVKGRSTQCAHCASRSSTWTNE